MASCKELGFVYNSAQSPPSTIRKLLAVRGYAEHTDLSTDSGRLRNFQRNAHLEVLPKYLYKLIDKLNFSPMKKIVNKAEIV